jgi:hypothetical protein
MTTRHTKEERNSRTRNMPFLNHLKLFEQESDSVKKETRTFKLTCLARQEILNTG